MATTSEEQITSVSRVEKRGAQSYRITIYGGTDVEGNPILHRKTIHTESTNPKKIEDELNKAVYDFKREIEERSTWEEDQDLDYQMLMKDFIEEEWVPYIEQSGRITQRIVEDYRRIARTRIKPALGKKQIRQISPRDIEHLYFDLKKNGLANTTCKRVHEVMRSIFSRAVKIGLIAPEKNPATRVDNPKTNDEYKFAVFTEEQAKRFMEALEMTYVKKCPVRGRKKKDGSSYEVKEFVYKTGITISLMYQAFFMLALQSGCRRGELCALDWKDIDFQTNTVNIYKSVSLTQEKGEYLKGPKTKAGNRKIQLPEICMKKLREWKEEEYEYAAKLGSAWEGEPLSNFESTAVFIKTSKHPGKRMSIDIPTAKFHDILLLYNNQCEKEEDKLPMIRLHDLRHTHASILLAHNVDIATVSHRLGHEKVTTTLSIYTHFVPNKDYTAANLLDNLWGSE